MAIGRDPTTDPKYLPKPTQELDPTTNKPWATIDEMVAKGKETEKLEREKKLMAVGKDLSEEQWEGIRSGRYTLGFDEDTKKAFYAAVPGKHEDYPILKRGVSRAERARKTGSGARLERDVGRDFLYIGIPGMGGVFGAMGIAKANQKVLRGAVAEKYGITVDQLKWLPKPGKPLSTINELVDKANKNRVRNDAVRVYGKSFDELSKGRQHILVEAIRRKVRLQPSADLLRTQAAERAAAEAYAAEQKLLQDQARASQGAQAGRAATEKTLRTEGEIAQAAGSPAVPITTGAQRPGPPALGPEARAAVDDTTGLVQGEKAAGATQRATEGRQVSEDLRSLYQRSTEAREPGKWTTGPIKKLSETEQAERLARFDASKKRLADLRTLQVETKTAKEFKEAVRKLKNVKLRTGAAPDEAAEIYTRFAQLEAKLVGNPGSTLITEAEAQLGRIRRSFESWEKSQKIASPAAQREAFGEAAKSRASREAVVPRDSSAAEASFKQFSEKFDPAGKNWVRKEVENMSGSGWNELNRNQQRNFVHAVLSRRSGVGGPVSGGPTVGQQQRIGARRQRTLDAQKQTQERRAWEKERGLKPGGIVGGQKPPTKGAPEAPPRPGGQSRFEKYSPEKALRSVAGDTATFVGEKLGVPKSLSEAWGKKGAFPWMTTLAGAGATGLYWKQLEDEAAAQAAEDAKAEAARQERIDAAVAKRTAAGMEKLNQEMIDDQWYEQGKAIAPKNWLQAYRRMHPYFGWGGRPEFVQYNTMLNKPDERSQRLAEVHAWKDFNNIVNKLRASDPKFEYTFSVLAENGNFMDFDVETLFPVEPAK